MLDNRLKKNVDDGKSSKNQNFTFDAQKLDLSLNAKALKSKLPLEKQSKSNYFQRLLIQPWNNLKFRTKLVILLMISAAIPVLAVEQGLVSINSQRELQLLIESLQKDGKSFTDEYVLWTQVDSETQAENLAKLVQVTNVDLSNPREVAAHRNFLQDSLAIHNGEDPEVNKNFQIFTDAQGKTVTQDIQIIADDSSNNPPLPAKNSALTVPKYRSVSLPTGIYLGDIPIVKHSLETGRSLSGMELLKSGALQRLGLEKQADIGLRTQQIKNLPESKQPVPQGTYDIDDGKVGLVSMAVHPIKINNKLVGTVIVGAIQNRNYALVDKFSQNYKVPVATMFAQDWRVSTNVPYIDAQTRAVGTRVAREVAMKVLNQGQEFSGESNILGRHYLAYYRPLYDHQQELNPALAKPVGMAFIGQSLEEVESHIEQQQLIAFEIGGGILLLVGIVAMPLAGSFARPLKRLSGFAQQLGSGEQGVRLENTQRQDEIGVLSQELNQMAASIDANLEARRQEAERTLLFAQIATSRADNAEELNLVFNTALQNAREILNADRVVIYRFNSDWSGYIAAESVLPGWPTALADKIEDACINQELIQAYKQGRVVPTNNVFEAGFHPDHMKLMTRLQIKANLVIPIVEGGKLFGLLIAHHCEAPHVWQQSEINFLKQLAGQLGLILERLNFVAQTQAAAERAQTIKDITVKLTQVVNTQDIFHTAVAEIRQALVCDRVVVYSFNDKWQGTVIAESVIPNYPVALGAEINDPCFADRYVERYRQGRVQATENIYKAGLTACHIKQLEAFAVKANLVAPIVQGKQLLGLLIAHQCSGPRAWQQGEIDLFAQLATQVGLALERTKLLEQQKTAKELLQKRALELLMEVDPVSRGDLTIRASVTEDEIGTVADSYNATINSLRKIVTQVQATAAEMATTTNSSEVLVQGLSTEALRQTEEITAALDRIQQMSDSIRAVAASAAQAEVAVQQATRTVASGDVAMNRTVDGIMAIRETVAETSKKVKQLGESSQKISQVVNLIGRFAAQTNLLALKASIEAARAGEEGRGFAVLADEVRVLARQSAAATAEIDSLVKEIQTETNEVVAAMETGTEQVVNGTKLVDETRLSLNQITTVSTQISELVAAIASAAVAQSQASESVTSTMTDVAAIAAHTSNEANVVSASFKELMSLAQELQTSAGQFKVN